MLILFPSDIYPEVGLLGHLVASPHSPEGSASRASFFFNKFFEIYVWPHWVFVAAHRLSLIAVHGLLIAVASLLEHRL